MALPRIRLVMFDVLRTLISPRLPIHVQYSQTFAPYLGMLEPESLNHSFNIGKLSVAPVSSINVNSSAERTSGRKACISEPRRDTGLVERGYQKDGSWSWGRCARYVGILVCCARDIFTKLISMQLWMPHFRRLCFALWRVSVRRRGTRPLTMLFPYVSTQYFLMRTKVYCSQIYYFVIGMKLTIELQCVISTSGWTFPLRSWAMQIHAFVCHLSSNHIRSVAFMCLCAGSVLKDLEFPSSIYPIILSEEEGIEKPSHEIFFRALRRVNVGRLIAIKPQECLYVGDELDW